MRVRPVKHFNKLIATGGILLGLSACSESTFNETSGTAEAAATDQTEDLVVKSTAPCVDGDRINLNFPAEIQSCVDQNKIFDFSTNACIDVSEANFECNFDGMSASVANIGVPNTSIKKAQEDGALLISCSEKNAGKTVIAQWYYPGSQNNCNFEDVEATRIVTACYKLYLEGEAPPTDTPEERNAAVQACLNE